MASVDPTAGLIQEHRRHWTEFSQHTFTIPASFLTSLTRYRLIIKMYKSPPAIQSSPCFQIAVSGQGCGDER